jgi:hypothetical protein
MYHLNAMLLGNLDDFVACQVCPDRCILTALANDVGFIGLCSCIVISPSSGYGRDACGQSLTLPVHAKPVLITVIGSAV